jgi:thioredoxin reductase (NADPH)
MSRYLIDQIDEMPNVRVVPFTQVVEAHGDEHLQGLTLLHSDTGERERVPTSALFIFIGAAPRTDWLEGTVQRDRYGFIPTGSELLREGKRPRGWDADREPFLLEASVPGVFAAGDVRSGSVKRVASGVGEGAIAVSFVHQYLARL